MATNYTGQNITAQSPSPAIKARALPVAVIPADPDAFNAAAFSQQHKLIADVGYYACNRILYDNFLGESPSSAIWRTPTGTVTVVDDAAAGGSGVLKVDGTGTTSTINHRQLSMGTTDFKMYFRVRVSGVGATSTLSFGLLSSLATAELRFLVQGSASTTNWRVSIDGVPTAANGTPVAIGASYADFIIARQSNVVTFTIGGVTLHTISPYATSASDSFTRLSAATAGIVWCDVTELVVNV